MDFSTLSAWLNYIGSVHKRDIELGIERVKAVANYLDLLSPQVPVITVAGTNGKGSTVAALDAIYRAQGYVTGAFTSPYLFQHNEEVKVNGREAADADFCRAFAAIEKARVELATSLTAFEFHTLAALFIFREAPLDVMILEVGLGGRLDAVNIIDADVAIVATIAIDHIDWLGLDRESIGREKAGIFRTGKPAICGDFDPPLSLIAHAAQINAPLYCQGRDFYFRENENNENENAKDNDTKTWVWQHQNICYADLPQNALVMQNMATALMAATLLQKRLPVAESAIKQALSNLQLPGRVEITERDKRMVIFDVAHNQAACAYLAARLKALQIRGRLHAVFAMLADKEIVASVGEVSAAIDVWHYAALDAKRAASQNQLQQALLTAGVSSVNMHAYANICDAYQSAIEKSGKDDVILVFGSFYTVASVAKL